MEEREGRQLEQALLAEVVLVEHEDLRAQIGLP